MSMRLYYVWRVTKRATIPVDDFLRAGAIVGIGPSRLIVAWGPFVDLPRPPRAVLALYSNDFFLSDPAPWKIPAGWCEVDSCDAEPFVCHSERSEESPVILWNPPEREVFGEIFSDVERLIRAGALVKLVPVLFEDGVMTDHGRWLPHALARLNDVPRGVRPYGIWNERGGMIGGTPEILFEMEDGIVQTMALAGTAPAHDTSRLVSEVKEKREHEIVVEAIQERLAPFGEVVVGEREIVAFGILAHLQTPLEVRLRRDVSCDELICALHPTPALGAVPRDAGMKFLRELDRAVPRETFGAPFGVVWPDGRARFVVAIRNIQWHGDHLRLGAGCGIVAGSRVDQEWEELRLKRESVKRMLGVS